MGILTDGAKPQNRFYQWLLCSPFRKNSEAVRKAQGSLRQHGGTDEGSRCFRRLTSAPSQLFCWKVYHGPSSLQPTAEALPQRRALDFPNFCCQIGASPKCTCLQSSSPITTINHEFMDQNAPATPHDTSPQLAKHINIGNSDEVGSIFSQLASNPFFTAVGRAAPLFLEAPSELNISTTIGIWLSRPCSCCARRPKKPQTGHRPASTSHAC